MAGDLAELRPAIHREPELGLDAAAYSSKVLSAAGTVCRWTRSRPAPVTGWAAYPAGVRVGAARGRH